MADFARAKMPEQDVYRVLAEIPAILSGAKPDPTGCVQPMLREMGEVALEHFYDAFIQKSRGSVDAAGLYWPDISSKTKAYSRQHAGLVRKKKGERPRGLLTDKQDKRWRAIFAYAYRSLRNKGDSISEAKSHAAAWAWHVLKAEGAITLQLVYGSAVVPILIDSGALAESLRPRSGHPDQIFRVEPGTVIVGTARRGAEAHQAGVPGRLPRRQLWPDDGTLPDEWQEKLMAVLEKWLPQIVQRLLVALGAAA